MSDPVFVKFEPVYIQTFMGGQFKFRSGHPATVGELRRWLKEVDKELDGWQDDLKISEIHMTGHTIDISLEEGIVQ